MKGKSVYFSEVDIHQGFWHHRQQQNANITIQSIYSNFKETGRFEAVKLNWKEGMPNKPHIFWDSDIAKWIEAASYIIRNNHDQELIDICDETIDIIGEKQEECGYYNIYFQTCEPQGKFTRRSDHELYCAGHLIEAAVAYYDATKKDKLLKIVCKYADYIEKVFVKEKAASFTTCGHEEIELALCKLYRCTNEKRYLELSKFFIDNRGYGEDVPYSWSLKPYAQDHLPVRQQTTAEGHSVRAGYLYTAMADIALEFNDMELEKACKALFDNIIYKRMYITGGIGSTYHGEAFSIDYDLPNDIAYAESCAAIALVFFSKRMTEIDIDSKYTDIIEKVLYSGFLSNISLDGRAFFYKNPLEIIPEFANRFPSTKDRGHFPETQRQEVFQCSCCPPNVSRLMGSLGDYIYSQDNDTLFVHQYITNKFNDVTIQSGFPHDGNVKIQGSGYKRIALRIPNWCEEYTIKLCETNATFNIVKGYAIV